MADHIVLEGVTHRFFKNKRYFTVCENISFSVPKGGFVSLIGPSGCGKTTLLNIVSNLIEPSHGMVQIDGQRASVAKKQKKFGFVFQDAVLLDWRNALDNIALILEINRVERAERAKIALELIELIGLKGFEKHYPDELSGGMKQRIAIARALSYNPDILLMDEPFGALDLITRDRMGAELLRIWSERQKTVLFVTHSIEESIFLSDFIVVLSAAPARIVDFIEIDLGRPRSAEVKDSSRFREYARRLRKTLEGMQANV